MRIPLEKQAFLKSTSQKWSNYLSEEQIHSAPAKNWQYYQGGVAKIEKSERHAGREAKKKTSATQQENQNFDLLNTPWAGRHFSQGDQNHMEKPV